MVVVRMNAVGRFSRLFGGDAASREFGKRYLQFSGMEFLFWFAQCAGTYQTVFLQTMGYNATKVGVVTAVCSSIGIFSTLFWGMFSDRIRSIRKVFILCMAVGSFLWLFVPLTAKVMLGPLSLSLLFITVSTFFRAPTGPLIDNWAVSVANTEGMNYGLIRSAGSVSFAVMGISLGFILRKTGVNLSFYLYALLTVPLVLLCFFVKGDTQRMRPIPMRELHVERLLKNYRFITFLIFIILMNMPSTTMFSFLSFLVRGVHGDINMVGIIQGYKALLEVPMLILARPLARRNVPYPALLICTACLFSLEAFLYAHAVNFTQLVMISTLHGLGGGLFIASASNYIFQLAPDGLKATAQTIFGAVNTVGAIIGSLIGGALMDAIGVQNFILYLSFVMLFAAVFYAATLLFGRRRSPGLAA